MKTTPPVYFFLSIIAMYVTDKYIPFQQVQIPLLGVFLLLVTAVTVLWVFFSFKRHQTAIKPHNKPTTLVTSGLFQVTRNPIYLSGVVGLVGVGFMYGSLLTFIFPFVFMLVIHLKFIPMEERNLKKAFPKEYPAYMKRVRRWV